MKRYSAIVFFSFLLLTAAAQTADEPVIFRVQIKVSKQQQKISSPAVKDLYVLHPQDSLYHYFAGAFKTYSEANMYKKELETKGFGGSFVVAYKGITKIPVEPYKKGSIENDQHAPPAAVNTDTLITKKAGSLLPDSAIQVGLADSTGHAEAESQQPDTSSANMVKKILEESNCATLVKDAEVLYNSGNYEECLALLQKGFNECKLSKREKEDAWILRARINIEKDRIEDINKSLVKLLKVNANYKPKEGAYQEDFYTYFHKVTVRPALSVGFHFGLNVPVYTVAKTYSILNSVDYNAAYKSLPGYDLGGYAEYEFLKNLSVNLGCDFSSLQYKRSLSGTANKYNAEYNENLKYLSVPLYLKKYFGNKFTKPYLLVGGSYSSLQKAIAEITVGYTAVDFLTNSSSNFAISKSNIDQKPMRTSVVYGAIFGAGCSHRIKNFLFHVDARYNMGLNYFTDSNKRLNNEVLTYSYYYVDNAVTINKIEVSGSIAYILQYHVNAKKTNE